MLHRNKGFKVCKGLTGSENRTVNAAINAFFISNNFKSRIKSIVTRVSPPLCLSFSLQHVYQQISTSELHRVQMAWCYSNPLLRDRL